VNLDLENAIGQILEDAQAASKDDPSQFGHGAPAVSSARPGGARL
jgi:hypothetical protein